MNPQLLKNLAMNPQINEFMALGFGKMIDMGIDILARRIAIELFALENKGKQECRSITPLKPLQSTIPAEA